MKKTVTLAGMRLLLDTSEGVLSLHGGEALCLTAKDTFDEAPLFHAVSALEETEKNDLCSVAFTAEAQTKRGSMRARYTFYALPGVSAVAVTTALCADETRGVELPLSWLRFTPPPVETLHCLEPVWSLPAEKLLTPTSFYDGMALETKSGCVGFFHGGEPVYDHKNNKACPDLWAETIGVTGYAPLHTAVLSFAPNADDLPALKTAADALWARVLPLLREPPQEARAAKDYTFTTGGLHFTLCAHAHGVALTRAATMGGMQAAFDLPLVQLCLRSLQDAGEWTVDSRAGWEHAAVYAENGGGRVLLSGREGYAELAAEITFRFPQPGRVEWSTDVLNGEQQLSVLSASYVPGPWAGADAACFVPEHSGWVAPNATRTHFYRDGIYPRGWRFTMGYFAAYAPRQENVQNGFYWGIHDAQGAFKTMVAETDPIAQTGLFFARLHAPGMGKGGNAFTLPGPAVWQVFSGDWYDACLLYKEFVHTRAQWLPQVGPEGREDTPLWARELPVWTMDWMPNTNPLAEPIPTSIMKKGAEVPMEYWYEEPIKLQKALGVPLGYHVYNWHWIPFNNDYPHYLPEKKEFRESLHKLRENGIRVMPYTNARLWDIHDKEGEDGWFTAKAKQWATKDADGTLYTEKYESHEPDGSLCELATMCPSSGVWKAEIAGILKELFGRLGLDGVYLDQIAAAAPYLCKDPSHNHLPGGGAWWAQQYNLMMRRNRQLRGENGILTTEDNAEVYAQSMDGFLTWVWTFDNLVPAFSVIYAGHVMMLGRTTNGLKKGDAVFFKYETAEQFLFGGQLGWMNADVAERPAELSFLRTLAQLRYRYAPFFYKGEALRPAQLQSDRPVQYTLPTYFDTRLFEARQVLTGTWQLWDGTQTVLFVINCGDAPARFTLCQQGAFSGAVLREGEGKLDVVRTQAGALCIEGTVAQNNYLVLDLKGE